MGGNRGGENKKTDHQGQNQLWVRPVSQIQLVTVWIFTFVACGRKSEKENFLIHESYMEFGVQCLPIELPWKQPHSSCVLYNSLRRTSDLSGCGRGYGAHKYLVLYRKSMLTSRSLHVQSTFFLGISHKYCISIISIFPTSSISPHTHNFFNY